MFFIFLFCLNIESKIVDAEYSVLSFKGKVYFNVNNFYVIIDNVQIILFFGFFVALLLFTFVVVFYVLRKRF